MAISIRYVGIRYGQRHPDVAGIVRPQVEIIERWKAPVIDIDQYRAARHYHPNTILWPESDPPPAA